jgi:hypothetical protein
MILQKLLKMTNTIPKPKATKRVVWNLRTNTKQNWHKTSTSVQLTYKIQCRRSSACEATKAQNSRLQLLRSCLLSLSLSDWIQQHYTTLSLTTKAHSRGRGAGSLSTHKEEDKKKTKKKQEKKPTRTTAEVAALLLSVEQWLHARSVLYPTQNPRPGKQNLKPQVLLDPNT